MALGVYHATVLQGLKETAPVLIEAALGGGGAELSGLLPQTMLISLSGFPGKELQFNSSFADDNPETNRNRILLLTGLGVGR